MRDETVVIVGSGPSVPWFSKGNQPWQHRGASARTL